jgi:hypothetical protein
MSDTKAERDELLRNLKAVAKTQEAESAAAPDAAQKADALLEVLKTSKVLDRDSLKRPVNI